MLFPSPPLPLSHARLWVAAYYIKSDSEYPVSWVEEYNPRLSILDFKFVLESKI